MYLNIQMFNNLKEYLATLVIPRKMKLNHKVIPLYNHRISIQVRVEILTDLQRVRILIPSHERVSKCSHTRNLFGIITYSWNTHTPWLSHLPLRIWLFDIKIYVLEFLHIALPISTQGHFPIDGITWSFWLEVAQIYFHIVFSSSF